MNKRFPLQVRIIGLMQHKKLKTYLASVLWSDQNDVIVYRTFAEFKKLHKTVAKKYPLEAGRIKKADRILPKFQDISRKERRQAQVSRSVLRIRMLQEYCDRLLTSSTKISEDQDIVQFFLASNSDLAPSFPSDSAIVMPSAVEKRRETLRRSAKGGAQSITQPMASENYKCIASYETKDTKNKPFKVLEDETVDVIAKNTSGWWLVENDEKQLAWFPAPYLKKCLACVTSGESIVETGECQYYAVKSYEAKNEDELSMNVGVIVEILKKSSDGWWFIRYDGQSGYVPSLYLQPYKNPHSKLQILTKPGRWASTPDLSANVDNSAALSNIEKQNMCNNQGSSPTKTINNVLKLQRQQCRSSTCLPDENLSEGELSLPNSDESDSRPESLCDDSSDKSESTEVGSLPDSYHILKGSDNVARLFEKNLTAETMSKNDSGVEQVDLSSRPETSTREKTPATNVVPKIPPRPHRREILSRCTTFTKNMALRSQNIPTFQSYITEM
ncbi:NADPH oxidase organizer 1 [Stegostoma tigrinum]|uniref:NADPH oxidase organizer 1 n=1 Tax=Stegostoma tigrinum TaxID=3053191 RepID=UPI0028705A2C|nr:NADPH oxidase organizer 1 [Stegostoma tigrinum]